MTDETTLLSDQVFQLNTFLDFPRRSCGRFQK